MYLYHRNSDPQEIATDINALGIENLSVILIENKIDLHENKFSSELANAIESKLHKAGKWNRLGISTKDKESLTPLQKLLAEEVKDMKSETSLVIHNSRHFHALGEALKTIERIQKGLEERVSGDLLSIELKEATDHIGSITGKIDHDHDVLGTIFSQFCIGK